MEVEAPRPDLVALIKAAQRLGLRNSKNQSWPEYLQEHYPHLKLHDPKRNATEVLAAFAAQLLSSSQQTKHGITASKLTKRFFKWAKFQREAQAVLEGVLPSTSTEGVQSKDSVWSLVQRTRAHPKYTETYSFQSYLPGWKRSKAHTFAAGSRPRLMALDCEMCATRDDAHALLGVCLVDEQGGIVYRELIQPEGEILDLRTELTGISAKDLQGVTESARDAQKAVRRALKGGVVLVGHALQHDLLALKLDHQPIIDTSLIFQYRGLPTCTPSLKDLAKTLLFIDMRSADKVDLEGNAKQAAPRPEGQAQGEDAGQAQGPGPGQGEGIHDSLEDASVTMKLAVYELQQAAPTPALAAPQIKVPPGELKKLLLHSLPAGTSEEALRRVFAAAGAPAFVSLEGELGRDKKLHAVFAQPGDANEAFKKLPGTLGKDSWGRATKEVALPTGPCKVRKMACHNGLAYGELKPYELRAQEAQKAKAAQPASKAKAKGKPKAKGKGKAKGKDDGTGKAADKKSGQQRFKARRPGQAGHAGRRQAPGKAAGKRPGKDKDGKPKKAGQAGQEGGKDGQAAAGQVPAAQGAKRKAAEGGDGGKPAKAQKAQAS